MYSTTITDAPPGSYLTGKWDFSTKFLVKVFGHWSHAIRFCFEWILLWIVNRVEVENFVLHVWLTFIGDEHELSLAPFIASSRSIDISFLFVTFNWISSESSNVDNFSMRWFSTFAIAFLAWSMFEEKSKPFLNFLTFLEIKNYKFEASNVH